MTSCLSYCLMLVLCSHACLMISCMSYGLMHVLWSHVCLMVSCMFSNLIFYDAKSSMTPKSWAHGPLVPRARAHGPRASQVWDFGGQWPPAGQDFEKRRLSIDSDHFRDSLRSHVSTQDGG